jgi:alpha-beta hydrolase superfamily lysophospholipase
MMRKKFHKIVKHLKKKIKSAVERAKKKEQKKPEKHAKKETKISLKIPFLESKVKPKQFEVITPDGIEIKLNFYENKDSKKGLILLPMLGKTKESMDGLAQSFYKLGYNCVAVDYRGHGGSELNWQSFRSKDFANMVYDVKAAKDFLKAHKITSIGLIGASIGANIALNFLTMDSEVKTAIALSPGIDYRGVKVDYSIPYIKVPVFIFTSKGDNYSFVSTQHIQKLCSSPNLCIDVVEGESHGMELLSNPKTRKHVMTKMQKWIEMFV